MPTTLDKFNSKIRQLWGFNQMQPRWIDKEIKLQLQLLILKNQYNA